MPHYDIGLSFKDYRELIRRAELGDAAKAELENQKAWAEQLEQGGRGEFVLITADGIQSRVHMELANPQFTTEVRRPIRLEPRAITTEELSKPMPYKPAPVRRYERTLQHIYGLPVFREVFDDPDNK